MKYYSLMNINSAKLRTNNGITTWRIIVTDRDTHDLDFEVRTNSTNQMFLTLLPNRLKDLPVQQREEVLKKLQDRFDVERYLHPELILSTLN